MLISTQAVQGRASAPAPRDWAESPASAGQMNGQFRTGASHIRPVFREVGAKVSTCSPGVLMARSSMGNGASSAGGGEDMLWRVGQAKLSFQLSGYGPAKAGPLAGAVTVQLHRVGGSQQTGHSPWVSWGGQGTLGLPKE